MREEGKSFKQKESRVHVSKHTIRFRIATLKYFAKKSSVLFLKSPLHTVLLFTDASDGASNKKSATEQKYLSARHLLPRARVGGAFLSTRWFPGNPQRLCFWLVSRKDARILRIVLGGKKGGAAGEG